MSPGARRRRVRVIGRPARSSPVRHPPTRRGGGFGLGVSQSFALLTSSRRSSDNAAVKGMVFPVR